MQWRCVVVGRYQAATGALLTLWPVLCIFFSNNIFITILKLHAALPPNVLAWTLCLTVALLATDCATMVSYHGLGTHVKKSMDAAVWRQKEAVPSKQEIWAKTGDLGSRF